MKGRLLFIPSPSSALPSAITHALLSPYPRLSWAELCLQCLSLPVPWLSSQLRPMTCTKHYHLPNSLHQPAWTTLTNQVSGVPGWPGPKERGDSSSVKAQSQGEWRDRKMQAGKEGSRVGTQTAGEGSSTSRRGRPGTHHFLYDRLWLGSLQLLLHLLFH